MKQKVSFPVLQYKKDDTWAMPYLNSRLNICRSRPRKYFMWAPGGFAHTLEHKTPTRICKINLCFI